MTRRRRPWLAFRPRRLLLQLVPLHLVLRIWTSPTSARCSSPAGRWRWPSRGTPPAPRRAPCTQRPPSPRCCCSPAASPSCATATTAAKSLSWEATARVSPDKARVHNNLGYAYAQAGRRDEAQHEYRRALQLDPQDYKARANLARLEGSTPSPPRPCDRRESRRGREEPHPRSPAIAPRTSTHAPSDARTSNRIATHHRPRENKQFAPTPDSPLSTHPHPCPPNNRSTPASRTAPRRNPDRRIGDAVAHAGAEGHPALRHRFGRRELAHVDPEYASMFREVIAHGMWAAR